MFGKILQFVVKLTYCKHSLQQNNLIFFANNYEAKNITLRPEHNEPNTGNWFRFKRTWEEAEKLHPGQERELFFNSENYYC